MLIRAAREDDFEAIAAILGHYIRHTAIHFAHEPISADELRAQWAHHRATYPFLVAETSGEVVGLAKAGVFRERAAYAWTPESGVYLRHDQQRRGAGKALMARLLSILSGQGFHSVIAGIALPNDPSVRLHEALGFLAVGRVPRAGWKLGAWHDLGLWQKDLGDPGAAPAELRAPVY